MLQIIGKGGFAREVAAYRGIKYCEFFEYECEGIDGLKPTVIAIGDPVIRKKMVFKFQNLCYDIILWGINYDLVGNSFGNGTIICPGTILTTNIRIGCHVILNINSTVGHDTVIDDFTTIAPGVNISGNVYIGKLCNIGSNVAIKEGISICDGVTIGAGGVVVKDITEPGIYVGVPVKRIDKIPDRIKNQSIATIGKEVTICMLDELQCRDSCEHKDNRSKCPMTYKY